MSQTAPDGVLELRVPNPSESHLFIQKILTEAYYATGAVPDAGDTAVNRTDNSPYPHQADILVELGRGTDRKNWMAC